MNKLIKTGFHEISEKLPKTEKNSYLGRVYAVKYGKYIKIGSSKNIISRIRNLNHQARYGNMKIGNMIVTAEHTNFRENEKQIHKILEKKRIKGTELFSISFKNFTEAIKDLDFLDESSRLEAETKQVGETVSKIFEWGKYRIPSDYCNVKVNIIETSGTISFQIKGAQIFMGHTIPVVLGFGADKKCVTDKTIAEIHSQPVREIRRRIGDNLKRFKEYVDFIDLKQYSHECSMLEFLLNLGYAKQSITQAEHIYLLSERGYAKLTKIMETDLAWEIHDKLVDGYFQFSDGNEADLVTRSEIMDSLHIMNDSQQQFLSSINQYIQTYAQMVLNSSAHLNKLSYNLENI